MQAKKHLFKIIDDSSDDDKVEPKDDSPVFDNSVGFKAKENGQTDDKVIEHSTDHVYHLDDFTDDEHLLDQQDSLITKQKNYALIDEPSDEDIHANNNTTNDGLSVNNNYIQDEAEEDLQGSDIESLRSVSDGDDKDSFIDDDSLGYYSTDDPDNDDDF